MVTDVLFKKICKEKVNCFSINIYFGKEKVDCFMIFYKYKEVNIFSRSKSTIFFFIINNYHFDSTSLNIG